MAQTAAAHHVLLDRQVDVETPEHVAIGYEIADLGSRFTALLLDLLLMIAGLLGSALFFYFLDRELGLGGLVESLGRTVMVFVSFALVWGYFALYEGLRDGQTPGKRRMGIRVVHDGGYPLTFRGSMIRNLARWVDMQPAATWAVGGVAMMLHPQTKRLGDMVAGTVVVRDRTGQPIPEETAAAPDAPALGKPLLTDAEYAALEMFAQRRATLAPDVRGTLARQLMGRLGRRFAEDPRRGTMAMDDFLVLAHEEEGRRRRAAGAGGRSGTAQATALVRRQRREWEEYVALLEAARTIGLDKLGEARVSRFAALYREVAADLARARTYGGSPELLYTLERRVGSGHNLLYRLENRSLPRFWHFVKEGFPALVRRRWKPIAVAAALFYLPLLLSMAAVRRDPAISREVLDAEMMSRAEEAAAKEARGEGYVEIAETDMPYAAAGLMANNIGVTFIAFAGGVLAGAGTVLILLFNGIMIGVVFGTFANYAHLTQLLTFVGPHGVVELTAICIAGGAGLWMGSGMLAPGRRTRREVVAERAREAVSLIGGTAMMLVLAGVIEGFISPSQLPREIKFAFAGLIALLMLTYFVVAGRSREAKTLADQAAVR
ncbi:MAG TPA: stage II sporulation protein M [Longimicrobium sp.]|nr:stage II sporulation protein M [Longimicrobium sp.]